MTRRIFQLLCLALTLAACDKSRKPAHEPANEANQPRATKSNRSAQDLLLKPQDQIVAAFQQAEEIREPEEKNRALAAAIWDAIELEPELARQGLQKLTAGSEEKNRLIQHFAMRLTEQNVDEAVQWAAALETEDEKSLAFGKIALVLSQDEPERAAHLLSESGVAGREFDVAVVQVVQRWAAQTPADAAAWVVLFDAGEARRAGLKETVAVWARSAPQDTFSWIAGIQDAQIREEAATGMVQTILDQPESVQQDWLKLAPPEMQASFEKLKAESAEK